MADAAFVMWYWWEDG